MKQACSLQTQLVPIFRETWMRQSSAELIFTCEFPACRSGRHPSLKSNYFRMGKRLLIIVLILTAKFSFGQRFTDFYGDYLGQIVPGDIPVVFAQGIIFKSSLEHSAAIFSSDGNEVYWCSKEFPLEKNKKKIWFMQRINNRWTTPQALDFFGDSSKIDIDAPFLSFNSKRLYFNSERNRIPKSGVSSSEWTRYLNDDIWFVDRQGQGWSKPQSISPIINNDNLQIQATFNNSGTVYFLSYLEGVDQKCGIFSSKFKDGNYCIPDTLPGCINSTDQDWTPYIAPDESYLIFSSRRHDSNDGGDLYISFYDLKKEIWTDPINMGGPINTWAQERFPTVSPDGKYLFFTRWTENNHQDIFWVSAKIIDRLRGKSKEKK